ncbi:MAG: hypothetical protein FIA97_15955 [Methylococcaceae bacterium]|nr:hypothetical protein [Methylococcaceae bacterium]
MNGVIATAAEHHDAASLNLVRRRLTAYLEQLKVTDPGLIETLLEESMKRAERRSASGDTDELMRRALEEIQRRIDAAVAKVYGLNPVKDMHRVAAARALSLKSGSPNLQLEAVLRSASADDTPALPALPAATPPEARLSMHPEPIAFFFGPPSTASH